MTDAPPPPSADPAAANRARGAIHAAFRRVGARTEVVGPFETGGYRLRLPRSREASCEAVIVNTGGGMAGGDRVAFRMAAERDAAVTLTTTAAEKIYRGDTLDTVVDVVLAIADGATLEWLPQETILFDGARLRRNLAVEMAPEADLLVAETLVFGRLAMGERMGAGLVQDRWRVRRGARLVLAEDLTIDGDVAAALDRPALGAGARASAVVALVSPRADALLDAARNALAAHGDGVAAGASAWNGMLVVRALSPSPARLRTAVAAVLVSLRRRALPRLWG